MSQAYDESVTYCRELGIPEDEIDDVIDSAELCCEGPFGEGCCAENTKAIIDGAAKKFGALTVWDLRQALENAENDWFVMIDGKPAKEAFFDSIDEFKIVSEAK